jgi:hypothetical protein
LKGHSFWAKCDGTTAATAESAVMAVVMVRSVVVMKEIDDSRGEGRNEGETVPRERRRRWDGQYV